MLMRFFTLYTVCTLLILMAACTSKPDAKVTASPVAPEFPDTVFVHVDSTGVMTFGGRKMEDTDALKVALTDSLLILKKQGGKLPVVSYRTHGDVLMGMRGALRDLFAELTEALK